MKTFDLYIHDEDSQRLTGELIRDDDHNNLGVTKWIVNWEGGTFSHYGSKREIKSILDNMTPKIIIGNETKTVQTEVKK